ncbi:MAG: FmdE family protein [Euryarchaeota archaeon]|nr:MAG: formylmethanofuran dehydrogenase subunit E [ANME-2 cluster archaeon]MEA1865024.1 FmdE family protein [Euryarchaeota archaeon]
MTPIDTESMLQTAIRFHGHQCPGLAMGVRVSEVMLRELGKPAKDEELVAIVENNSCGVDAIQALTGCTFAKGNLIFKDFGKFVYTFVNRENQRSLRISIKNEAVITNPHHTDLFAKVAEKRATPDEMDEFKRLHIEKSNAILNLPEADLLTIEEVTPEPLPMAHIHESICCDRCSEPVMESRIRLLRGGQYCIPCFEELMK